MRKLIIFLCCIVYLSIACSKKKDPQPEPETSNIVSNIVYGNAVNFTGNLQPLLLDIYKPTANETIKPLILFIHGGSFLFGDKNQVSELCKFYNQKGFIAVSINYRLGWNFGTFNCDGDMPSLKKAAYRGIQDTHSALRFLVANAKIYGIDTSKIFIGGVSAGGVLALQTGYLDKNDVNEYFPNFSKDFGEFNTSGNNLKNTFTIKGVVNMWGGVLNLGIISKNEKIPIISFHGTNDTVVPYDNGTYAGCLNYSPIFGSKAIYDLLKNRNTTSVLHSQVSGGHGVYNVAYIATNSYCFIKGILANNNVSGSYNNFLSNCD